MVQHKSAEPERFFFPRHTSVHLLARLVAEKENSAEASFAVSSLQRGSQGEKIGGSLDCRLSEDDQVYVGTLQLLKSLLVTCNATTEMVDASVAGKHDRSGGRPDGQQEELDEAEQQG